MPEPETKTTIRTDVLNVQPKECAGPPAIASAFCRRSQSPEPFASGQRVSSELRVDANCIDEVSLKYG
jgi:hypothetical protein